MLDLRRYNVYLVHQLSLPRHSSFSIKDNIQLSLSWNVVRLFSQLTKVAKFILREALCVPSRTGIHLLAIETFDSQP